jgi:hypothetical protein
MTRASFQWQDPFLLDDQLSEEERMIQQAAYEYCQRKYGKIIEIKYFYFQCEVYL